MWLNVAQVVLQCLYSQCQTTQFGSALHRTLSACSGFDANTLEVLPPLIRHQGLRKRGIANIPGHVSASAVHSIARRSVSTVHSVTRRSVSASAFVSTRPTRRVSNLPAPTPTAPSSLANILEALISVHSNGTNVLVQSTTTI